MNSQLLGQLRLSRADALRRLDLLGHHPSIGHPATVARVDDPDGHCAILAVRGVLDAHSIDALWDEVEALGPATTAHLDLTDASILPGPWMGELEALVDALEEVGCSTRVVGLNPHHPDLWPHPDPLDPPT